MHDIKLIRKDPNLFLKKLGHRNTNVNIKNLLDLDEKNRKLIQSIEKLEQLPVLLSLLARVGFIDSEYLKKRRKYVIVIIFAVAAILTPPDPITQIGLGIPLLILYELSILSVKIIEKKKKDA